MSSTKDVNETLHRLKRENAELSGLALATGVILTQLLQTMTMRELNPQRVATKIISNAAEAIEVFEPREAEALDAAMRESALKAVKYYEEQLRSVLPI
jgi:hypothetical protein